jgi:hypothetical protein
MGADYSFYVKTIETHARAFFKVIIFSISSVRHLAYIFSESKSIIHSVLDPEGLIIC